jgi:hypothetical protein
LLLTLDHRLHLVGLWLRWGADHLCSMEGIFPIGSPGWVYTLMHYVRIGGEKNKQ